jgi:acetyl esterase/lipase
MSVLYFKHLTLNTSSELTTDHGHPRHPSSPARAFQLDHATKTSHPPSLNTPSTTMDASPGALFKLLVPKTPLILKTTLLHSLSLSHTASKCDLKTALLVSVLRSMLNTPTPMGKQQYVSCKDPGIKGPIWISKTTFPIDNSTYIKDAVGRAIEGLKGGRSPLGYTFPEGVPISVEWTGHRSGVDASAPEPKISESEKFTNLMAETTSPVTVLYFHGGAYCVCDPSSHRDTTRKLAKLTSGRVCSIRYRLAPQNPFPAALMDALLTYLSLLSPPPGSLHTAVDPAHIVFAGDSAGGNLALVLLALLLELRRQSPDSVISFHGRDVPLHLPAALALNSPWCDVSRSMPSTSKNAPFDYLPTGYSAPRMPSPPSDQFWPTTPPRVDVYASASMLDHPLVSPLTLPSEKWKGAPPVYMCLGEELLADEGRVTAKRIHAAGSTVVVEAYVGMPHCFAMMLPQHPATKRCFGGWTGFISQVVKEPASLKSKVTSINPVRGCKEEDIGVGGLTDLEDRHIEDLIKKKVDFNVEMERTLRTGGEASKENGSALGEDLQAGQMAKARL